MVIALLLIALMLAIVKLVLEHIKFLSIIYWLALKGIKEPNELEMKYVTSQVIKNMGSDIRRKLKM
ncbi:hypothetical protein SAMN02745248_02449 [Hathewaya proteolytica DSM 3090]|uniref:Uncharacterized protein n=1 Tax=Hathewaya proteolytica DSM 3090 TaxID=1121331 RepID=A0A1M6S451_9CLOT|nr:hypothetical protein [Hathewaya proteolytica]SHK39461.1 hypothetical protein SAMN02745248_02449 [Hathewaya proteolytica DSM 3090]